MYVFLTALSTEKAICLNEMFVKPDYFSEQSHKDGHTATVTGVNGTRNPMNRLRRQRRITISYQENDLIILVCKYFCLSAIPDEVCSGTAVPQNPDVGYIMMR